MTQDTKRNAISSLFWAPLALGLALPALVNAQIIEYPLPDFPLGESYPPPGAITKGPDGNLWYTRASDITNPRIGKITTSGLAIEYPLPTAYTVLGGITAGPDGNVWFTTINTGNIGKITPAGVVNEYGYCSFGAGICTPPAGPLAPQPFSITTGPDGNMWWYEGPIPAIQRIRTTIGTDAPGTDLFEQLDTNVFGPNGVSVDTSLLTNSLTTGPDGNLWLVEPLNNTIQKIPPGICVYTSLPCPNPGLVVALYPIPTAKSAPTSITAGPDGNLWFTERAGNKIGKITPAGAVTEYPLPTANAWPYAITAGSDGNLWFTENNSSRIGKITPLGVIAEYLTPTPNSSPAGITAGPDGNVWFTENGASNIGEVLIAGAPPTAVAIEYYYSVWNFYFVTAFPEEIAALDGGAFGGAWQRTGQTFNVWPQPNAVSSPTCRFFSTAFAPKSSHFYTPFPTECAIVKTESAWEYEGIAFYIQLADANGLCDGETIPLYRAYNNGMGGAPNHRYTTSLTILNQMVAAGWVAEGNGNPPVLACVPQ